MKFLPHFLQTRLYLEINNDNVILGIMHKSIISLKKVALDNSEVVNGKIHNPSHIIKEITTYIKDHQLPTPKTVISFPYLAQASEIQKTLLTLQAAVLLKKAPIKIATIIDQSLLADHKNSGSHYNHLTYFYQPHTMRLALWLIMILLGFGALGISLVKIHAQTTSHQIQLFEQNKIIEQELKILQTQAATSRTLQTYKQELSAKVTSIQRMTQESIDQADLLATIAEKIPASSWLTKLKINTKASKRAKKVFPRKHTPTHDQPKLNKNLSITIQGITPLLNDATAFIHNLSASPLFKNLSIVNVKKLKRKTPDQSIKRTNLYTFTIAGQINQHT